MDEEEKRNFITRTSEQVSKGLDAWGIPIDASFEEFGRSRHQALYPDSQRMAMEAGAGGHKYFTPAGKNYRAGIREEMTWLKEGVPYTTNDWKRLLHEREQRETEERKKHWMSLLGVSWVD